MVHLLRILGKLVDNKEYTDNELENLNWEEKSRLIQSDPVTFARHFDYQIYQFIQNFLLSEAAPLGKISDWFYRVEYQQRGSPHTDMDDNELKQHKDTWKCIKKHLNDMKEGEDITFDQLLLSLEAQKGMSERLRTACEETRRGNMTIKQQVRDIGNTFLNNVEISAQKAVYIVLGLAMRKCSRQIVFINISPPEERVRLLKPLQEINKMDEIYASGLIKRYIKRPASLENVSLANWAAWYNSIDKPYIKQSDELDIDNYLLETNLMDDNDDDNEEKESCKKRIKKDLKPELFENARYVLVKAIIDEQMKQYAMCSEDLNEIQDQLNNIENNDDNYDLIAPGTQNIELQDESEGMQDLHPEFNKNYDLSGDLGIPSTVSNTEHLILHEEQDDVYRAMVQKLNREQKEFFYHVLHLIKISDNPFYCFLSGGAGVGKSHLTKCHYQAALKYYNTRVGDDFHQVKILMLAPTGKAAYNIKSNTKHSALAIPACQSLKNYKPLDSSRLNTLRCQLGGLKLIFLDEISMVGSTMFNVQKNNRLKDIKGLKDDVDFGAIDSVIGANSAQLRNKILSQIPDDPRKTKQIALSLQLSVEERTEIALNVRTDDGMTNGCGNVVKKIQLNQRDKPSGIIWVQFDHPDVGEETRHENRHFYIQGIESTWTPIKPTTTQFAVGRNQTAQVVRKQFPLRPAAAKTIHRSEGDTEQNIVVNFNTRRSIPHVHYVGLSRVTAIEGLFITDLCEDKIAVKPCNSRNGIFEK
ncbi:ATP-dependent DNA helicase PIF1 [Paramuricea clavata]|uniref:ATP-dependent DNA helicase n=1 Tax=Paramuricea clavata TaxID=317549 RepID=A0A7D9LG05_PARCT|nr:ATP-dependent DNA helicase PIF1 [Paramuricea clavata]